MHREKEPKRTPHELSASPSIPLPSSLARDPGATASTPEAALAYVRRLTRSHYENFSVLSLMVPPRLRDDFAAVYAFCRWSDDLGDETGSDAAARQRSLALLGWWRGLLTGCFDFAFGRVEIAPQHPVFVTLAETIKRHGLTPEPFHHLIDAFEQDQRVTAYQTWDQLIDYCTRSANPVGRIVLGLGEIRSDTPGGPECIRMSDATCTALQLTNFWQDVRRDLVERDRVYLPSEETGITPAMLRDWSSRADDPAARLAFIKALRPLVHRTRGLFAEGRPLPAEVGGTLGRVIRLFGAGGEHVLSTVERRGCTTLWTRPRLGKLSKAALVAMSFIAPLRGRRRNGTR